MEKFKSKPNACGVWRNDDKKSDEDNQPHFRGHFFDEHGTKKFISIWKTSKEMLEENPRRPLLSVRIQTEAERTAILDKKHRDGMKGVRDVLNTNQQPVQQTPQPAPPQTHITADDFDDDIPF